VERSEEIRRIVERWFAALSAGDVEAVFSRFSDHPGVLAIGTDSGEWWHGHEHLEVWGKQIEDVGGAMPVECDEVEAWEESGIGWAAAKVTVSGLEIRITWVLHLERGEWKAVQRHHSLAQSEGNEALWGKTLAVTIEQLEKTVRHEQPDLSGAFDSDGTITIVFTDIVESTVLLARLGDQAWLDLLRRHNAVIESATAEHGGTVVETQGDGSMLAFSSARRAVACAKAIQSEIAKVFAAAAAPIRVRIGIHTGDALHEADHFYGTTVHYAARVASNALGGEVLVSNLVRELVQGSGLSFRESREVELKGLEGSHHLFAVDLG
jgi:adenylate cyclase